jgi:phosphoribosyl 1,2-cyclic phosphate phosphodiesterase
VTEFKVTILGCGTSSGVPLVGCKCAVCRSKNKKNKRLRASIWLQVANKSFVVDTTPDLRQQALREKISHVDAVLYTHPHADHIQGIDDLRAFNFIQKADIPVYGNSWTVEALKRRFDYIFNREPNQIVGGGIASLKIHLIDSSATSIDVCGVKVIPVSLDHAGEETLGFRLDDFAYVTDCKKIPIESQKRLMGLKVLMLDCVKIGVHPTHFNLAQALEMVQILKPRKTILTHMGHDFDFSKWQKKLPKNVSMAYDGQKLVL